MEPKYKIIRRFFDPALPPEVLEESLSLEEAKEAVNHPDSSSRTCTHHLLVRLTERSGPWFESYEEE